MSKRTPEEIAAWRAKMTETAKRVRALPEEERQRIAASCGTTTCEGHPLSFFNTVFLWSQAGRPLLRVAGYRQWRKVGRWVKEGEHAAGYIYVPMKDRKEDGAAEVEAEDDLRFRLVPVFDVSQTEEQEP